MKIFHRGAHGDHGGRNAITDITNGKKKIHHKDSKPQRRGMGGCVGLFVEGFSGRIFEKQMVNFC